MRDLREQKFSSTHDGECYCRYTTYHSFAATKYKSNVSVCNRLRRLPRIKWLRVCADKQRNNGNENLVRANDVVFALHAFFITLLTFLQTFIYKVWSRKPYVYYVLLTRMLLIFPERRRTESVAFCEIAYCSGALWSNSFDNHSRRRRSQMDWSHVLSELCKARYQYYQIYPAGMCLLFFKVLQCTDTHWISS